MEDRTAARGPARIIAAVAALALLAGCGDGLFGQSRDEVIRGQRTPLDRVGIDEDIEPRLNPGERAENRERSTLFDLFDDRDDPNTTLEVNKYLWAASLDVLSFMPVQNADPFSGIIQFGYGTPPGGGRAYQATVYVRDPALDARSLNVALRTRGGAAPRETQRAIEDAILTRARQLRIQDSRL